MDSTTQTANEIRTNLFADPEVTAIYLAGLRDVSSLCEIDRERFRLIMTNALWSIWNTYSQSQSGGRQSWSSQRSIASRLLAHPGGIWFWDNYRNEFDPEFQLEIDKIMKEGK
jgi:hypothetical protein